MAAVAVHNVPHPAQQLIFPVIPPGMDVAYLAQLAFRCAIERIPIDFPDMNCVPRSLTLLNADKIFLQLVIAHVKIV
jgi:hypothetical protein